LAYNLTYNIQNLYMKYIIIILLAVISFNTLLAQIKPVVGSNISDPKAKALLDLVSKKYKSYKTIKANFKLKIENAVSKVKDEKKGLLILKAGKYFIQLEGQEITCDLKTTWTYLKESNEVQINTYEPDAHAVNPSEIFTMYEKGFIYQLAESIKEAGKDLQVVELTPTDKAKNYFKIKLFIDKASSNIVRSLIFDKNGNKYSYEIVQFAANTPIEDAQFTFDLKKHPGVEVNDIR
jgi:outer membrane lipoprotein carrier protein